MTLDVTKAIEPRSDQLNADSLLTGPRTIRLRDVKVNPSAPEQPIWIYFDGDDGKPWKPCKTAARCLAAIWGPDASKWIGMSCTIYVDMSVTWGGAAVGGIRVSHMEGLAQPRSLMLTKTRGKKGVTIVKPLVADTPKPKSADPEPEPAQLDEADPRHVVKAAILEAIKGASSLGALKAVASDNKVTIQSLPDEMQTEIRSAYAAKQKEVSNGRMATD